MPQVEFHILSEAGDDLRMRHACKLVDAVYEKAQRVFVRVGSDADARRFDELLWTFRDQAFIPHEIVAATSPSHPRIMALIGIDSASPPEFATTLINLSNDMPISFASFDHIFEVVDADPHHKQLARERYKQYRERGCTLETKTL